MAKVEIKFIDTRCRQDFIQVEREHDVICISGEDGKYFRIFLDKSTAIKFAKTLRTEINKIKEV